MNTRLLGSAALALSLAFASTAGAVTRPGSPSATESQQDATTVQVFEQNAPAAAGEGAPAYGVGPTATRSQQNATTVDLREANAVTVTRDAPRIGVSPSAPSYVQDATTVQ